MDAPPERPDALDLLYPFYLDSDMSMAFAAVLTGGVSLEEERLERLAGTSEAIRNLHGNLRLWRIGGVEAGHEKKTRRTRRTSRAGCVATQWRRYSSTYTTN